MADAKPGEIQRSLEGGGNLYISKFWTGLYTNRSPLFTPVSALGIQLIARQDTLWDGLNMMITPQFTLKRRYGFLRYCPTAFSSTEWPLTFFSFQMLAGNIYPLVDTQKAVYHFLSTANGGTLTNIYTKAAGAVQTNFNSVADIVYFVDGKNANKWDGTTVTQMGINSPIVAPTLSYQANGILAPTVGYQYGYAYENTATGTTSTMSPASPSTGPLNNQTIVESRVPVSVTATAYASSTLTVTATNNFEPGQNVTFKNLGVSTFLNGQTGVVLAAGLSNTQFELSGISSSNYSTVPETQGQAVMSLSVPNTAPYEYTVVNAATFLSDGGVVYSTNSAPLTKVVSGPTVGQYAVSAGTYTFAAADINAAIDITYSFSLAASTGVSIVLTVDGSADTQVTNIILFRTDDGGAQYYQLAVIANPGAGMTATYTDNTPDSGLNNDIIAAVAELNNPPAAGMSLLTWYGGRLWGAVGNTLYFSAGPDATIGVGEEAWPPGNNYTVPGKITAMAGISTGLVIWTYDDAYVVTGQDSSSYTTPLLWQSNWGVQNQNSVAIDGDNVVFFTSRGQLYQYNAGNLSEIGFMLEYALGAIAPGSVYVAIHRSSFDEGIFVSDGSTNLYRYSQAAATWDTVYQPVGGVGCVYSLESAQGFWHLFMGRPTGSGYILDRDTSTYSDDGALYTCFATIGSLTIAPPRQIAKLESILTQLTGIGTYPTVSVMLNEITDTGTYPTTFTALPNPKPDPPQLAATQSIWTRRHDLKAAQRPLPMHVQHLQVKISFIAEAQPNELIGLGLAHESI